MDMRIDEKGKYYTPRVAKDTLPAFVRTADQVIVGHVYVRPGKRLKDDLNEDTSRFLPITDARVYDAGTETLLYHSSFLLIAYSHIVMLSPLDALANIRPAPWNALQAEEESA
ncbi:MAG TPA: hypothetical protein VF511_07620 [Chthoniobacterales bacterium]